jgi:hypothetical protein
VRYAVESFDPNKGHIASCALYFMRWFIVRQMRNK